MTKPQNIARLRLSFQQRIESVIDALVAEITQEGIARTQRKKGQRWPLTALRFREQPVDDFVGSPVATNGNKLSISPGITITRDCDSISEARRLRDINLHSTS